VVDDAFERLVASVTQKLAWVREGAARYLDLELSLIPTLVLEEDRVQAEAREHPPSRWRDSARRSPATVER
jgi:hypothetical protein